MTTANQSNLIHSKVTMTLATIAATAATPRPSGEDLVWQALRAWDGITTRLANAALDTNGTWQLKWVTLSPDNANLAYIAWNADGSNQFAVVLRGTVGNATDLMEDLDVGTVVPFTACGSPEPVAVSAGAMAAFTQIVNAPGIAGQPAEPPPGVEPGLPNAAHYPWGPTLIRELAALLASAPSSPQPTVCVTGHSLGGCIATMLATYLQAQTWPANPPRFALVTFAAPTAGLQGFADYVDSLSWSQNERHINAFDVIPLAWSDVPEAKKWYPKDKGPEANDEVKLLLTEIDDLRKPNVYVQPSADSAITRNEHYTDRDPALCHATLDDYLGQVAYQHANSTYLHLLGAQPVPDGPVVRELSSTAGPSGTQLTIFGSGFTPDSVVDFGPIPCTEYLVDVLTGMWIAAVVPDGVGIVDVRVTTRLGTSPAVPLGRFAYGGPPPVVVTRVDPTSGAHGTPVTIYGSGFVKGAVVRFKDREADDVDVVSPSQISVKAPIRLPEEPKTMNVTVTMDAAPSPTSAADEFTYTG